MKAVILAAGKGMRLEPLTKKIPKVMIRFLGKPLLHYQIKQFRDAGIDEIILVISNDHLDIIKNYFKKDKKIHFVVQEKALGPADAIYHAKKVFPTGGAVVLYGDSLTDENIVKKLLKNCNQKENYSMFVTACEVDDPTHYGILKLNKDKNVIDIIEKPKREEAPSNLGFQGCFYIKLGEFYKAFEKVGKKDQKIKEETHCMKYMMQAGKVGYWISNSKKIDVGRPWNVLEGNKLFLDKIKKSIHPSVKIDKTAIVRGPVVIEEGTRILENAVVKGPAYIGKNCLIGTSCLIRPYSSIEDECIIGAGSEIKNSSILTKTKISHYCFIGDSVVGSDCLLGAHFITANYKLDGSNIRMVLKGKLSDTGVTHFGAIIGDNTKIGCGAITYPGRKIGCSCIIEPGVIVKNNVPSNTSLCLKQEVETKNV